MKSFFATITMIMCITFIVMAHAESPVVPLDYTSVRMENIYDSHRQVYFIPRFDVKEKPRELDNKEDLRKLPPVAIIDTGILSHHPLVKDAIVQSKDFTGEGIEDTYGHGTLTALLFLTQTQRRTRSLLIAKIIGKDGKGTISHLIEAIQWAVQEGAETLNLSVGIYQDCRNIRMYGEKSVTHPESCEQTELCKTIAAVTQSGKGMVIPVAAVGNIPGKTACPACCRDTITVDGQGTVELVPYRHY